MNETSNMNSSSTGGVCSSCLKEMPIVMASSTNPVSKLCSNCMTEFIDQQHFYSGMNNNNKFPLLPSSQLLLNNQQQNQSIYSSHFSSLPSSSASSTSSSVSSTNRRLSAFDPFASGNSTQNPFLHPFNDLNNSTFSSLTSTNFSNDIESQRTPTTNDFMRFFLNGTNHHNDRDCPASSIQSTDFSQSLFSRQHSNRLSTNDIPPSSSFCCFANNSPYTYCLDCETSLCEKCALTHPKIIGFKDHRQQLLPSQTQNNRSIIGQSTNPG